MHIHTCLSPCADLTMVPGAIIKQAKMRCLDMIGICDHNSTENVLAVKAAGKKENICVLGGIEVCSREEAHIMGFFDNESGLKKIQEIVFERLPGKNDEKKFGKQVVVDELGQPVGSCDKLLIGAASLSVEEIVNLIHGLGGLAVASHIDRESFGIIGQLGFIPEGLALDALEVSRNYDPGKIAEYKSYGFPLVKFSDAHFIADIGEASTTCLLNEPSFGEFTLALGGIEGRKVNF